MHLPGFWRIVPRAKARAAVLCRGCVVKLWKLFLGLGLGLAALRFVPIGSVTYVGARVDPANNIAIARPHYWVPREIVTEGIPLPGGEFGLFRDPHFAATEPRSIEIDAGPQSRKALRVQGFDVNPMFKSARHKESVLAFEVDAEVAEVSVAGVCFSCFPRSVQLSYVGMTEASLVFMVTSPTRESAAPALVSVSLPIGATSGATAASLGSEEAESLTAELREFGKLNQNFSEICAMRRKNINAFWEAAFGKVCER